MRKLVGRPSPTLVISMLALFVALGSVALAGKSDKAPKNSVNSKSIKKGAVKTGDISNKKGVMSQDIVDGEVKGSDVDESSLGEVPSSATSEAATSASDSDKVDGLDANSLVRVAGATAVDLPDSDGDALTAQITAPRSGFLYLVGSVEAFNGGAGDTFFCQLEVDNAVLDPSLRVVDLDGDLVDDSSVNSEENCSTNVVAPVSAGVHSVDLSIGLLSAGTELFEGALNVLFVPFDGTGS